MAPTRIRRLDRCKPASPSAQPHPTHQGRLSPRAGLCLTPTLSRPRQARPEMFLRGPGSTWRGWGGATIDSGGVDSYVFHSEYLPRYSLNPERMDDASRGMGVVEKVDPWAWTRSSHCIELHWRTTGDRSVSSVGDCDCPCFRDSNAFVPCLMAMGSVDIPDMR